MFSDRLMSVCDGAASETGCEWYMATSSSPASGILFICTWKRSEGWMLNRIGLANSFRVR